MGKVIIPVINEEVSLPRPALLAAVSAVRAATTLSESAVLQITHQVLPAGEPVQPADETVKPPSAWRRFMEFCHRYSLAVFALLFLAVGVAGVTVGGSYWTKYILARDVPVSTSKLIKPTIAGLNLTVPASQLQTKLQTITGQPATLTVGGQQVAISPDTIKSWLQITTNQAKTEDYIRIKAGVMTASLNDLANQFVKAPLNAVTVPKNGANIVVVGGRNGVALTDPSGLKTQADQAAKTVMNGKGLSFNGGGLTTQPFQSVTPAAFDKVLIADVVTKQMGAYQNGQLVNSWLVSAGAPATPTNIGEFKIYAKYTVQDMRGFNPNGTPYFQPRVPWVNYFSGGDAVHGNYWRPASVFGNANTSHGCVSLPVDEAEWVYNWAPIGTTVITTTDPSLTFTT